MFNPLKLSGTILEINIESMKRLFKFQKLFLNMFKVGKNSSTPHKLSSNHIFVDKQYNLPKSPVQSQTIPIESPQSMDLFNLSKPTNDANILDQDEQNYSTIQDRPIDMLENLGSENVELLNLHGIHTYHDLEESNLSEISRKTGISRSKLYSLKRLIP